MVKSGVYSNYIQNRIIQAQYYRDPTNEKGEFLAIFGTRLA